jgi:hypothetical protein
VLTGVRAVAERWHNDGGLQQWRELNAGAEEGKREVESEGRRCGFLRGCTIPFIGAIEAAAG